MMMKKPLKSKNAAPKGKKRYAPPRAGGKATSSAKSGRRPVAEAGDRSSSNDTRRLVKASTRGTERPQRAGEKTEAKNADTKRPANNRGQARPQQPHHLKREKLQRKGQLLWGLHAVREAWLNPARKCYRLWATDAGFASLSDALHKASVKQLTRPEPQHAEKSEIEHFLPQGAVHQGVVLEVDPLPETSLDDLLGQSDGVDILIVLDQVTDPHNIGAILRSAAAFGASGVIVTERNAPGTTGIMAKTACGALEHVPLVTVVNIARTIEALQAENFWCIGLAEEGPNDLATSKMATGRIALVMGAEGDGLRRLTREHCDELARLPTGGAIGSLNVSNASAVALYEARRQKTKLSTT